MKGSLKTEQFISGSKQKSLLSSIKSLIAFLNNNSFLLVAVMAILFLLFYNPRDKVVNAEPGKTEVIYLNDSTKYYQQEIAVLESKKRLKSLQDELEREISRKSGTTPVTIIRLTESINYDSLYAKYTNPLRDSVDKYKGLSDSLFNKQTLASYEYKDKWLYQKGRVLGGGIAIDSLNIVSKPHVLISEKGLFNKELKLQVINENPNIDYSDIKSFTYKPRKNKIGITVGPTAVFNGRLQYGVGLTIGYKIL